MIHFASGAEALFALVLLIPFVFFAGCALYLLRLAIYAAGRRASVAVLRPTEAGTEAPKIEWRKRRGAQAVSLF